MYDILVLNVNGTLADDPTGAPRCFTPSVRVESSVYVQSKKCTAVGEIYAPTYVCNLVVLLCLYAGCLSNWKQAMVLNGWFSEKYWLMNGVEWASLMNCPSVC